MSDAEDVSKKRVRAFVDSAVRIISQSLVTYLEVEAGQAAEIARNITHDLCSENGGTLMYVPRDMGFELSKRDMEIFHEFNGRNLHQMVKKYGVTHTRIYQIHARVLKEQIKARQGQLPGLENAS